MNYYNIDNKCIRIFCQLMKKIFLKCFFIGGKDEK